MRPNFSKISRRGVLGALMPSSRAAQCALLPNRFVGSGACLQPFTAWFFRQPAAATPDTGQPSLKGRVVCPTVLEGVPGQVRTRVGQLSGAS